jgi:hypothetical protein
MENSHRMNGEATYPGLGLVVILVCAACVYGGLWLL